MWTVWVCLAFLIPATAAGLTCLVCTVLGMKNRRPVQPDAKPHLFTVLIPAHDEESTLGTALDSLAAQAYPATNVKILVVADNCSDATAEVARRHGAECLVRTDEERRGKGFAIAAGIEMLERPSLARPANSIVLILDADCELSPTALRELNASFAAGADVVQAAVQSRNADDGPAGYVAAVGAAVDRAVASGRDRLGFRVPLRGTGMALRHEVLNKVKWNTASPVEDAEYARELQRAGVRVRFCPNAVVSCDAPATLSVLCRQRRRWALAGSLASKPLALVQLFATAALCFACNQFTTWAGSLLLITALIYLKAMLAVGLTRRRLGLLALSPIVVLRLLGVAMAGLLLPRPRTWDRTPRMGEGRASGTAVRFERRPVLR